MAGGGKAGLAAAVEAAAAEAPALAAEAEPTLPLAELQGQATVPAPRRGRPAGSRNKATQEQIARIRAKGMMPLDYLASIWQEKTVPRKDRVAAAIAALPYVHQKLPAQVEVDATERLMVVLADPSTDFDDEDAILDLVPSNPMNSTDYDEGKA